MTLTSRFPRPVVFLLIYFSYVFNTNDTIKIDLGVDFTIFEVGELENEEVVDVELARDLESNCDVTLSVTCFISSHKCDTDTILVSVSPFPMLRNSKIMRYFI